MREGSLSFKESRKKYPWGIEKKQPGEGEGEERDSLESSQESVKNLRVENSIKY